MTAVHVADDARELEEMKRRWQQWGAAVKLVIVESPYRALMAPLLAYIDAADRNDPERPTTVVLAEFVYVSRINRNYYSVQRTGYSDVAAYWGMPAWWAKLDRSKVYCAVGFVPRTVMLTGPTMSEHHIIEANDARDCPPNVVLLQAQ